MIKKTITYTDYNGQSQTEDFYFNLSKIELTRLDLSKDGGYESMINKIISEGNVSKIFEMLEEIVTLSYGEKSEDGKQFVKNDTIRQNFVNSAAYQELVFELISDENAAAKFVTGIVPQDLQGQMPTGPEKGSQ